MLSYTELCPLGKSFLSLTRGVRCAQRSFLYQEDEQDESLLYKRVHRCSNIWGHPDHFILFFFFQFYHLSKQPLHISRTIRNLTLVNNTMNPFKRPLYTDVTIPSKGKRSFASVVTDNV